MVARHNFSFHFPWKFSQWLQERDLTRRFFHLHVTIMLPCRGAPAIAVEKRRCRLRLTENRFFGWDSLDNLFLVLELIGQSLLLDKTHLKHLIRRSVTSVMIRVWNYRADYTIAHSWVINSLISYYFQKSCEIKNTNVFTYSILLWKKLPTKNYLLLKCWERP